MEFFTVFSIKLIIVFNLRNVKWFNCTVIMASHLKIFWRFLMKNCENKVITLFELDLEHLKKISDAISYVSKNANYLKWFDFNAYSIIGILFVYRQFRLYMPLRRSCVVCVCVFFPCFSPFVIHSTLKFRSKITLFLDLCVVWMLERERGGGKRVVRTFSILILLVFPASFSFSLLYCRTLVIRFCICFRRVCMISASFI